MPKGQWEVQKEYDGLGTPTIGNGGDDETNGFDAERLYEAMASGHDGV